jgi:hypothetical protein
MERSRRARRLPPSALPGATRRAAPTPLTLSARSRLPLPRLSHPPHSTPWLARSTAPPRPLQPDSSPPLHILYLRSRRIPCPKFALHSPIESLRLVLPVQAPRITHRHPSTNSGNPNRCECTTQKCGPLPCPRYPLCSRSRSRRAGKGCPGVGTTTNHQQRGSIEV